MNKFEEIIELISANSENVNFAEFGNGVSDEWIERAQQRLNVVFPPSYIWWLKNYGGGEIFGEEIFSVYEIDFDSVVGGDVVYINELDRNNGMISDSQLVILITDNSEVFYFDLLKANDEQEYPVYKKFLGKVSKYADDFLSFLKYRITDKY